MASRCGFSLHCSTSEVKHLFICLLAILIFSSENCQYTAFADVSIKMLVSQPLPISVYLISASLASGSAPLCYSQCLLSDSMGAGRRGGGGGDLPTPAPPCGLSQRNVQGLRASVWTWPNQKVVQLAVISKGFLSFDF